MPIRPDLNNPAYLAQRAQMQVRQQQMFIHRLEWTRGNFVRAAERAAAKHPEIDIKVFQSIVDTYNAQHPQLVGEMRQAFEMAKSRDGAVNQRSLRQSIDAIRAKYGRMLSEKATATNPEQGEAAIAAIREEMQGKGLFGGIASLVYNGENNGNGIQWAGLLGGLGAGFAAFKLTSGSSMFTQIVGTIIMGLAGAYFAHKYIDPKPEAGPTPDLHSKYRSREPARSRVRERGDVTAAAPSTAQYDEMLARGPSAPADDADARSMGVRGTRIPGIDGPVIT